VFQNVLFCLFGSLPRPVALGSDEGLLFGYMGVRVKTSEQHACLWIKRGEPWPNSHEDGLLFRPNRGGPSQPLQPTRSSELVVTVGAPKEDVDTRVLRHTGVFPLPGSFRGLDHHDAIFVPMHERGGVGLSKTFNVGLDVSPRELLTVSPFPETIPMHPCVAVPAEMVIRREAATAGTNDVLASLYNLAAD
jgi:hypothetical protein